MIDQTLYDAGASVYADEAQTSLVRNDEVSDEAFKTEKRAYFDENIALTSPKVDPVKLDRLNRRDRAKYQRYAEEQMVSTNERAFGEWFGRQQSTRTAARDSQRYNEAMARYEYLKKSSAGNPELQKEYAFFQNALESQVAGWSIGEQYAALTSTDPHTRIMAERAFHKVEKDMRSVGATEMDIEGSRVKSGALMITPDMKSQTVSTTLLDDEQYGQIDEAIGISEAAAQDMIDVNREATESFAGSLADMLDPKKSADIHVAAIYKNAGEEVDEDSFTGAIPDNGKYSHRAKALSEQVRIATNELSDAKGFSYSSRNTAIVTTALEEANISPDEVSPQEYKALVVSAYSQLSMERDIRLNSKEAASVLKVREDQKQAMDGVMGIFDSMLTQSANSPESMRWLLENGYGTADALSAVTLLEGDGKMDVLNALKTNEFKRDWANSAPENRYALFTDAVLDNALVQVRNMPPEKQSSMISVINGLRVQNLQGGLGGEPLLNHQMSTLYSMFNKVSGVEIDEEAKADLAARVGGVINKKYAGKPLAITYNTNDERSRVDAATMELAIDENPSIIPMLEAGGLIIDGKIVASNETTFYASKLSNNYGGGRDSNKTLQSMEASGGNHLELHQMREMLNGLSSVDTKSVDLDDVFKKSKGVKRATSQLLMGSIFGTKEGSMGARIAKTIMGSTYLSDMWNSTGAGDAKLRESVLLTALDKTFAENTEVGKRSANEFLASTGIRAHTTVEESAAWLDSYGSLRLQTLREADPAVIAEDAHDISEMMLSHSEYLVEIDDMVEDQKKTFGTVDEHLLGYQHDMREFGAVLLKYENEIQSLTADPLTIPDIAGIKAMQAENPWLKHGEIELVKVDNFYPDGGYGKTRYAGQHGGHSYSTSGPKDQRFDWYIVPKGTKVKNNTPPSEAIAIPTQRNSSLSKRYFDNVNESLFSTEGGALPKDTSTKAGFDFMAPEDTGE